MPSINVTAGIHDNCFILIVDGPTYGRRDDLFRLGFKYCEPDKCWHTSFDIRVLDILESWPEIRLTIKASSIAQRIREAQRKREAQNKAAAHRVLTTLEAAHAA
jgi:hypothetical protein